MIRAEKFRDTACVRRLVKRSFSKRDRKRFHCFRRCRDRKCGNTRRINSTRQKNAERNVRNQTHANSIGQQFAQVFRSLFLAWHGLRGFVTELPVRLDGYSTIFERQFEGGRK